MPTILRASLALPILSVLAACTSSNPTPDAGPGAQLCPVTIVEATAPAGEEGVTSTCHVDNYVCAIGFACGSFIQQASCTCNGTAFVCTLPGSSTPLTSVSDPTTLCQPVGGDGGSEPCPTDKTTASGTACTNAGEQCFYSTTCTSSPPPTDVCQCIGNQIDAGLSWSCDLNQCP